MKTILHSATALVLACAAASGQVTLPSECETDATRLLALGTTPRGVADFGVELSSTHVYAGRSLRCFADFTPDPGMDVASFSVGAKEIVRPALSTPANVRFFSLTVLMPDLRGEPLNLRVVIREDDDDNGSLDPAADDEWEASVVLRAPGIQMLNIPVDQFVDNNPSIGSDGREFATTKRISLFLTFETRRDLHGAMVQGPVSLWLDHAGLFEAPQTIPPACRADLDGSGALTIADLFEFLRAWFAGDPRADFDSSGSIGTPDIFAYLHAWFAGCAG